MSSGHAVRARQSSSTSLDDFRREFPSEAEILRHIARIRLGPGLECPVCFAECQGQLEIVGRIAVCTHCAYRTSITRGTLFADTKLPLSVWFYLMLLTANDSHNLPVAYVSRHLGISRLAAFRMQARLRLHLRALSDGRMFGGGGQVVQVDEAWLTFVKPQSSSSRSGAIVIGVYSSEGVITKLIERRNREQAYTFILQHIHSDTTIVTDRWRGYLTLANLGFKHVALSHETGEFVSAEGFSTIGIEGYWANLKHSLASGNITPRKDQLDGYLSEHAFLYSCRKQKRCPFRTMIAQFPDVDLLKLPPSARNRKLV